MQLTIADNSTSLLQTSENGNMKECVILLCFLSIKGITYLKV